MSKSLYTEEEFNFAKSSSMLLCQCGICKKSFLKRKRLIEKLTLKKIFCSRKCRWDSMRFPKYEFDCAYCGIHHIRKYSSNLKKKDRSGKLFFCNYACHMRYQQKTKTIKIERCNRSKLERWLEIELTKIYPSLEILYNTRKIVSPYELGIYIPSLKLAIELNGPWHYFPIHGEKKLQKIQFGDMYKSDECRELKIALLTIDVSQYKNFNQKHNIKYLNYIIDVVNEKLLLKNQTMSEDAASSSS